MRRSSWPELVQREVGISDDTARRWMQASRAQLPALAGRLGVQAALNDSDAETLAEIFEIEDLGAERIAEEVAKLSEGKTLEQLLLPLDGNGLFDPGKLTGKARDAWEKIVALCEPYDDDHLAPQMFERGEYDAMHADALVMRKRVEAGECRPPVPGRACGAARRRMRTAGALREPLGQPQGGAHQAAHLVCALGRAPGEDRTNLEAAWRVLWDSVPGSIKADVKKLEGWK